MSDEMRFSEPIIEPEKVEEVKVEEIKAEKRKFNFDRLKFWQKIKIKKQHLIMSAVALVFLIVAGTAVSFYIKVKNLESENRKTPVATAEEVQNIVSEVGNLIVLPQGEVPTVATVSDVEKLRDQPFFANAINGDKVLIYTKAGKAILYDPFAKKIVEVAPLNVKN
jgi:hypothetical protein